MGVGYTLPFRMKTCLLQIPVRRNSSSSSSSSNFKLPHLYVCVTAYVYVHGDVGRCVHAELEYGLNTTLVRARARGNDGDERL
jgi:hypothetical protein